MKDTKKKVSKALAREIAAKFFGRTVKLVEDVDPTRRRVFYNDGYVFKDGLVRVIVFPYCSCLGSNEFEYPNKYPCGQIDIDNNCTCCFKYVDGVIETQNCLLEERDEFRNALWQINNLLGEAIDETKFDTGFRPDELNAIKNKNKLLKLIAISKEIEDKYL